jgi:hypothetical protein
MPGGREAVLAPQSIRCSRNGNSFNAPTRINREGDESRRRVRAGRGDRPADRHEGGREVEAHIADAVKKGAKVVIGGKRAAQGGSFFEPAVLPM